MAEVSTPNDLMPYQAALRQLISTAERFVGLDLAIPAPRERSATEVCEAWHQANLHQSAFVHDFDAVREKVYQRHCSKIIRDDFAQRTVEYWNIPNDIEWWEQTSRFRNGNGCRQGARRAADILPDWSQFASSDYAPTQRSIRFHDETPTEGSIPMTRVKGDSEFQTIDNFMTRLITPQNNHLPARSDVG